MGRPRVQPVVAKVADAVPLDLGRCLFRLVVVVGIAGAVVVGIFQNERWPLQYVPVASRDLSPYRLIGRSDLELRLRPKVALWKTTLRGDRPAEGGYPRSLIARGDLLDDDQLGPRLDPAAFPNATVVAVPATAAMVLDGGLRPGDRVDLVFLGAVAAAKPPAPQPTRFENLLVLDVKPDPGPSSAAAKSSDGAYRVVVAIPLSRRFEFARSGANGTPAILRRPLP